MTYDVRNPDPGWGQAQRYDGVKPDNEIHNRPSDNCNVFKDYTVKHALATTSIKQ